MAVLLLRGIEVSNGLVLSQSGAENGFCHLSGFIYEPLVSKHHVSIVYVSYYVRSVGREPDAVLGLCKPR